MSSSKRALPEFGAGPEVRWLGRVDYDASLAEMEALREQLISEGGRGHILLLEHPPVITLGRSASRSNILLSPLELERRGILVRSVSRGGDATYHGPGQLMVYLVVRVEVGIRDFLMRCSSALAETAAEFGVSGCAWQSDPAGLWWRGQKMAACGLHMHRGVSTHGFAFNVSTPPSDWNAVVPCGLVQTRPVSLEQARGGKADSVSVARFAELLAPRIASAVSGPG